MLKFSGCFIRLLIAILVLMSIFFSQYTGLFSDKAVSAISGIMGLENTVTATVTADVLNLRAEPSTGSAVIKTLKKGNVLGVTGEAQNGWVPITHDGTEGYVSERYVEIR